MFSRKKGYFFMQMRECMAEFLYDCECRKLSKGTLRNYSCQIGYLVEHLEQEGYIDLNAAAKVKNVKQPQVVIESFSSEEVRDLLAYFSGANYLSVRNRTIIALLFATGIRCNEMIQMRPEDIGNNFILIKHGKGGKERVVAKSPHLGKQLLKYERTSLPAGGGHDRDQQEYVG